MKYENVACPFCDASTPMSTLVRDREMDFEGVTTTVHNFLYSKCGSCEMETVTPQQTRLNKRTIIEAHKSALGLLTAAEIVLLRKQLGITQIEAAQLFGGGVNAFSKYENSAITQSKAMDTVLRLARDIPAVAEYLATREKVSLRKIAETPIRLAIMTKVGFRQSTSEHWDEMIDCELIGTGNFYEFSAQTTQNEPTFTPIGGQSKKTPHGIAAMPHLVFDYSLSNSVN